MTAEEINRKIKGIIKEVTTKASFTLEVESVRSVMQNFDEGGRPIPWPPSAKLKKDPKLKTLIDSGDMSLISADTQINDHGAEILLMPGPSSRAYSRIQHEGGVINMPARKIRFRKNKSGRTVFAKDSHKRITKETMSRPYSIVITPRPYLLIPDIDFPRILNAVESAIRT